MQLSQLFYVSRATAAYDSEMVKAILSISRRNNHRDDITGCLLFSGKCFGQVLEGRPEVILSKLKKITSDNRHLGVRLLFERPITIRDYQDWSMGYLHDLHLEDDLEALLTNSESALNRAEKVMDRLRPDTVMGPLR